MSKFKYSNLIASDVDLDWEDNHYVDPKTQHSDKYCSKKNNRATKRRLEKKQNNKSHNSVNSGR